VYKHTPHSHTNIHCHTIQSHHAMQPRMQPLCCISVQTKDFTLGTWHKVHTVEHTPQQVCTTIRTPVVRTMTSSCPVSQQPQLLLLLLPGCTFSAAQAWFCCCCCCHCGNNSTAVGCVLPPFAQPLLDTTTNKQLQRVLCCHHRLLPVSPPTQLLPPAPLLPQ
jgi:hypothetical protein